MANLIASLFIGGFVLYCLYYVALALYFMAFGDEGFTWTGLVYVVIWASVLTAAGFAAYGIGNLILSAYG